MRTKSLLAVAALIATGIATSMAQSNVYSLNVVGYVNVGITNGSLHLLSNPLKPMNGNYNITNTIALQDPGSDSTALYTWDPGSASWVAYTWFDGFGWFPDAPVALGTGFFIQPTLTQTITLVGEVQTGTSTNAIGATSISLLGSKVPVAGNEPGGSVGNDGDNVYTWDVVGASWVSQSYFAGYGWFDATAETNGPALKVAEGLFYQNSAGALNWIKTLNP